MQNMVEVHSEQWFVFVTTCFHNLQTCIASLVSFQKEVLSCVIQCCNMQLGLATLIPQPYFA